MACAVLLSATAAGAAARIFPNVPITPVIRYTTYLTGGWHTIRTAGSVGSSPDPVMHVANSAGAQVAYNDDTWGFDPQVTFLAGGGDYTVLVYSWSATSGGNTNLLIDGVQVLSGAHFEGRKLDVDDGPYVYRAANRPGTWIGFPQDPYVYGINGGTQWVSSNDDGGTGHLFALDGHAPYNVTRLVVGDWTPGTALGSIDVYQNDVDNDSDGDGLGLDLETLLLSCDRSTQPGCGGAEYCAEVDNPSFDPDHGFRLNRCFADSDRDGIDDGLEVFGLEDAAYTGEYVHFPGMGASPTRKDIFVEVDYDPGFLYVVPITEGDVMTVVNHYWAAPTPLAHQRAGAGFAVHMDIGKPCWTSPQYCGAWGGSNQTPTSPPAFACDDGAVPGLASTDASFRPIRRKYFRYAAMKRVVGAGGGVTGDVPGRCMNWDGSPEDRSMPAFTHELGHTLGLEHWGHLAWGSVHCKPHYASLMSYSGEWPEFSLGTRLETLNPAALYEAGAYAGYSTQDPLTYLQRVPPTGNGARHNFGFETASWSVNWDFYADYSAVPVRANPLQPVNDFDGCPEAHNAKPKFLDATHTAPHRDARLLRVGSRIFAFWLTNGSAIQYASGALGLAATPGSCGSAGGADLADTNTPCTDWGPTYQFDTLGAGTPQKLSLAVAPIDSSGVAVAWRDSGGRLWSRDGNVDGVGYISEVGVPADLGLAGAPEMAVVFDDGPPATRSIGIFYARGGVWWTRTRTVAVSSTWTLDSMVFGPSATVPANDTVRASVIAWPGSDSTWTALGQTCAVIPSVTSSVLGFWCRNRATGEWIKHNNAFGAAALSAPSLMFHTPRLADGSPIAGGEGQFWVANADAASASDYCKGGPAGCSSRLYRSETVSLALPSLPSTVGVVFYGMDRFPGYRVSLYEDSFLGSAKALSEEAGYTLKHSPFFDGTFNATLKDGNDFAVIETGICHGLNRYYASPGSAAFCGRRHANTLVTGELP